MNQSYLQKTIEQQQNRRAARRWTLFIVLLLGSQVGIGVAAIVLAGSDPTVAVVPGYHQKALLWDESVALRNDSRKLGWTVELRVLPGRSTHRLNWTIRDRDQSPLENLQGQVVLYHHTRANEPIKILLQDHPQGIELDRLGLWQVEMTLASADLPEQTRFFDAKTIEVKRAK